MTDTTTTPVAEAAPDAPHQLPEPQPTASAAEVDHTPGGWPVVPLAVTGTNTTASLLGAAALVGGPAALALAATGAVVLGATAATRNRRDQRKNRPGHARTATSAAGASTARSTRHGAAGRVPSQSRNGNAGTTKGRGRSRGTSAPSTTGSTGGAGASHRRRGTASRATGSSLPGATGKTRGRVGQVKALREAQRQTAPSRAARRAETTGARRSAADARRAAKSQARTASMARKGAVGRGGAKVLGKASKARSRAVDRARTARDQRAAGQVKEQRASVRKAPARKRARKALWRSAARFQGRRLLAALLAGALGIVGMFTTPLGRKLGIGFLQRPGRRLYARLMRVAGEQRTERDEAIRAAQEQEEAAAEAEAAEDGTKQIRERAERPAGVVPAAPDHTTSTEGEIVSGFRFEEYAAEMESAANSYDPDNAMEILAMVEGLPAALTSVANVMRILAERADSEFPLEKEVANGFSDIFGAVMSAVAVAEDMGPIFRQAHEQDIARHEDPRNGPEAEKGWNV
ncbi:hypothetical protein H1V43_27105 [Streptomyces sp. PSKA54]|uniref:Uncharacterized protein n=1 Tax=Streptomyces himalayensis subsp. aureolus TaxID=2758039 RepID=A0A7W2D5G7_9ACTN|nr:hypothetical protein [Streptomyces himalayensis]MBA4864954.1 hypothetical protein [Streptomyces himalayensis subsp. aureolus]